MTLPVEASRDDAAELIGPPAKPRLWPWLLAILALIGVLVVGQIIGGEIGQITFAGIQVVPFAVLALLAYLGARRLSARVLAVIWLLFLLIAIGAVATLLTFAALHDPTAGGVLGMAQDDAIRFMLVMAGVAVASLVGLLGFVRRIRIWLAPLLPAEFDPTSFIHAIAFVTTTTAIAIGFIPLIVLGEPPLLAFVAEQVAAGEDLTGGRGAAGMLRDTIYGLIWLIPGAIVAVGFGIVRDLRASLVRLGLVRPTGRQVIGGLLLAVGLLALVHVMELAIGAIWSAAGWPQTDAESFGELISFAFSPIGAVVIGITAGLGEELAVRGALQPRLGIVLSNLFFTGLHAFQYGWDALVIVFTIGIILGIVRRRTNTTTSAIVHGTYDFLLTMLIVIGAPGFE